MQQTSHFQLSQWEGEDRILRENFNSDNAKVDAALGGLGGEQGRPGRPGCPVRCGNRARVHCGGAHNGFNGPGKL